MCLIRRCVRETALEVAGRRATVSTLRLRAAQEQLGRTLTRTSRIARVASGTLAALGGPIGVILTAVSLGATAWALWGRNAGEASRSALEQLREVEETARSATQSLSEQNAALLAQSETERNTLTDQISQLLSRLQALRQTETRVGENQFRGVSRGESIEAVEARIAALQMQRQVLSDQIASTRESLRLLDERNAATSRSAITLTTDINALTAAEKRRAESLQVLLARQPANLPDIQGQQNTARDVVRGLEDQISAEHRRQMQLAETVDLRGQELRAAQASQQVLNEFADQQRDASRALLDALNAEILATNVLVAATLQLSAEDTDANRQALRASQDRVAATQQAAAEAEALLDALAGQGPAYAALAGQLRSVLEEAADGIQETGDRFALATQLATSGVNALENSLVTLATTGKASFRDFANSLLQDLSRILIRATITANILRALGVSSSGGVDGGLLGRLQTLFGGVPQAHGGGVVGQLRQRHQGALRPNERIAVLEKGEEVLTRHDPRHANNFEQYLRRLPRYHEGGVVGEGARTGGSGRQPVMLEVRIENRSSVRR